MPGIGFAEMGPGDLGLALAISRSRTTLIRRRSGRRGNASLQLVANTACRFSKPARRRTSPRSSMREFASSPGIARRQRLSDALTKKGRCWCKKARSH